DAACLCARVALGVAMDLSRLHDRVDRSRCRLELLVLTFAFAGHGATSLTCADAPSTRLTVARAARCAPLGRQLGERPARRAGSGRATRPGEGLRVAWEGATIAPSTSKRGGAH